MGPHDTANASNRQSHNHEPSSEKEEQSKSGFEKNILKDIDHPSKKMIIEALFINLGIALSKLFAALLTGSVGMMAETFHSFGDIGNQLLLLLGIKRSLKPPDKQHPFGYGQERFLWPFVVSTLVFGLSGVFAIQIGVAPFAEEFEHLRNLYVAYVVLAVAFVLEAKALKDPLSSFKKSIENRGEQFNLRNIIREFNKTKEPSHMTLVVEDASALLGIIITTVGIILSDITGNPGYDAIAAVIVGIVLILFASHSARNNKRLLMGLTLSKDEEEKIRNKVFELPQVKDVVTIKSMHFSPEDVLITLEVVPDLDHKSKVTGDQEAEHHIVKQVEQRVKDVVPYAQPTKIYVELKS